MLKNNTTSTRILWAICVGLLLLTAPLFTSPAQAVGLYVDPGWTIFHHTDGPRLSYRYSPSFIVNTNNTIHIWTCSPGGGGEWDWIRHRQSHDGGITWTEGVDMQPTDGSNDTLAVCDPGVVRFGGYYYMGYTSTMNPAGTENHVFVARKACLSCTWQKWNGSGWGGNPVPFIWYTGPTDKYGAGEPSLVVKGDTLYIYYTWNGRDATGDLNQTRVATAPTTNPNWPAAVTLRGVAIQRSSGEDSTDVKFVPGDNVFIGVAAANRLTDNCYIRLYQSVDGLSFSLQQSLTQNIQPRCHNAGISGDELGHMDPSKMHYLSYAFDPESGFHWGYWDLYLNPIWFIRVIGSP